MLYNCICTVYLQYTAVYKKCKYWSCELVKVVQTRSREWMTGPRRAPLLHLYLGLYGTGVGSLKKCRTNQIVVFLIYSKHNWIEINHRRFFPLVSGHCILVPERMPRPKLWRRSATTLRLKHHKPHTDIVSPSAEGTREHWHCILPKYYTELALNVQGYFLCWYPKSLHPKSLQIWF